MAIPKIGKDKKVIITNDDAQPINFSNNTVIDGYAGNEIEKYIKYIDGKILEVDYYSFIRGDNGIDTVIDVNDDTQQYNIVKQLQLTITNPINTSNYEDVKFNAVLNAGITPAKNDIVVLRLIDGRLGMFVVSEITKQTYITAKIYNIELSFLYYSDHNKEYFDSLFGKVKKVFIYDKSHITSNSAPIILESAYKNKIHMQDAYNGIMKSYLDTFIYQKVISVLHEGNRYFDFGIQKLILSLAREDDLRLMKTISTDYDARVSIIDEILDGRVSMVKNNNRYYTVKPIFYDVSLSSTLSLLSSDVKHSIVPDSVLGDNPFKDIVSPVNNNIPIMFRASNNNQYLFSNTFYDNNPFDLNTDYSKLEYLLKKYISRETIDHSEINILIDDVSNWKLIEQYYYVPFLLLIMNYSLLNTYSRI